MGHHEQLRQLSQFRALTLFEHEVAEALAPFQTQLATLERERGDYTRAPTPSASSRSGDGLPRPSTRPWRRGTQRSTRS